MFKKNNEWIHCQHERKKIEKKKTKNYLQTSLNFPRKIYEIASTGVKWM